MEDDAVVLLIIIAVESGEGGFEEKAVRFLVVSLFRDFVCCSVCQPMVLVKGHVEKKLKSDDSGSLRVCRFFEESTSGGPVLRGDTPYAAAVFVRDDDDEAKLKRRNPHGRFMAAAGG